METASNNPDALATRFETLLLASATMSSVRGRDEALKQLTDCARLIGYGEAAVWTVRQGPEGPELVGRPELSTGRMRLLAERNSWPKSHSSVPHVQQLGLRTSYLVLNPLSAGWQCVAGVADLRGRPQVLTPVVTDSIELAVVQFDCGQGTPPPKTDLQILDALANWTGLAVENQLARERLQSELRQLVNSVRVADFEASTSTVIHQIRAKLTAMRQRVADAIEIHEISQNKAARDFLIQTLRELEGWFVLVNNKLSQFRSETKPAVNDLIDLIRMSCHVWSSLATAKGCRLRPLPRERSTAVFAPAASVREALACLIINAIEAGARNVDFDISDQLDGFVEVLVRDDGAGIAPEAQAHLFSFGYSTKGSRGTGMGMVIVDYLARSCGGDVQLREPGKAGGAEQTVFALRLPKPNGQE